MFLRTCQSNVRMTNRVKPSSRDPGPGPGGGGVLPYMGHIGMCSAKGYGFPAVLVINRVSILAILLQFW